MTRGLRWAGFSLWMALGALAFEGTAQAQSTPRANAEAVALFKDAKQLMEKGSYAEACPKLEESQRIDPGVGTLYNLADCYEHIRRTASAWSSFREVERTARMAGQEDRAEAAHERVAALEPTLMKLRVSVPPAAVVPGFQVERDGALIMKAEWGSEVPLDPGTYALSAQAPGRKPWISKAVLEQPGKVVSIEVPVLEAVPAEKAAPDAGAAPVRRRSPRVRGRPLFPAFVMGGFGVVGLGTGLGLLVAANGQIADAEDLTTTINSEGGTCKAPLPRHRHCDELDATRKRAANLDGVALGAFVGGGAAAVGTVVYLLMPLSDPDPRPVSRSAFQVVPIAGRDGGGISVSGSF